jgi:hypothetical protein
MDQAGTLDFDLAWTSTIPRRDSSFSQTSSRLSISSDSWPTTPLLPHTPTALIFPRSSSGQSIPIFFDAEDVAAGDEVESEFGSSMSRKEEQEVHRKNEKVQLIRPGTSSL